MTKDRVDESLPEVAMPHCEVRKTLTGQKALVTGASSGIGKGVALHAAGAAGRTRAARHRGALHRLHPAGCVSEGVHRNRATLVTPTVRFTRPICLTPTKHHPTERTDDDTHDRDA
jgi:hypothetical protein